MARGALRGRQLAHGANGGQAVWVVHRGDRGSGLQRPTTTVTNPPRPRRARQILSAIRESARRYGEPLAEPTGTRSARGASVRSGASCATRTGTGRAFRAAAPLQIARRRRAGRRPRAAHHRPSRRRRRAVRGHNRRLLVLQGAELDKASGSRSPTRSAKSPATERSVTTRDSIEAWSGSPQPPCRGRTDSASGTSSVRHVQETLIADWRRHSRALRRGRRRGRAGRPGRGC